MIFFKYKTLAKMLHNNEVSEKQQMFYLLILCVFNAMNMTAFINYFYFNDAPSLNIYDYATDLIVILGVFAIIFLSYRINQNGDGKNFLARYICLSFPIYMISLFYLVLLLIPILAVDFYFFDANDALETTSANLFLAFILYIIFIYLYTNAFKIASGQKELK